MPYPVLFSIIGAITGAIIAFVPTNSFLFSMVLIVVSFLLSWGKISKKQFYITTGILASILLALTLWFVLRDPSVKNRMSTFFIIALVQITVICTAFIQSWKSTKPHYAYFDLFENVWNNKFFLLFSALFTGGFLGVLSLGTVLFDSIGINASKIIWSKEFIPVLSGALIGAGIGISREYDTLIFKIRGVFFALFRIMAYLAAAIVILFAISLPFTWDVLFQNKNTSFILLSVVAVSILLLNTLIDKGSHKLPIWANRVFSVQIVLLPFLAMLSVYSISLRISQYGLMPNRVIALSIAILLSIYGLAYLYQLFKYRGHWSNGLIKTNPSLAGLWVVLLIALNSPLIDPVWLSVNSQVNRLKTGKVSPDQFDYYALKNRLGKRGKDAIKDIRTWKDHPQFALIKKSIDDSSTKSRRTEKMKVISVIGKAPDNLEKLKSRYSSWKCNEERPCFIKSLKVHHQSGDDSTVVFSFIRNSINSNRLIADIYEYDKWWNMKLTLSAHEDFFSKEKMQEIIKSLKEEEQQTIQPIYYDLEVLGIKLRQ